MIYVITSSPNKDGLTSSCAIAAVEGIYSAGGIAECFCLNDLNIHNCHTCSNGWGTCLNLHYCQEEDDFQPLHKRVASAEGIILVSPVYWGEMSESAKAFTDRIRRCEATQEEGKSCLFNKPVMAVAAAGGSGRGMITCLLSMERWIQHVQARVFDLIPVNRWSREYKITAIRSASKALFEDVNRKG